MLLHPLRLNFTPRGNVTTYILLTASSMGHPLYSEFCMCSQPLGPCFRHNGPELGSEGTGGGLLSCFLCQILSPCFTKAHGRPQITVLHKTFTWMLDLSYVPSTKPVPCALIHHQYQDFQA